jgi:hypothetical protein
MIKSTKEASSLSAGPPLRLPMQTEPIDRTVAPNAWRASYRVGASLMGNICDMLSSPAREACNSRMCGQLGGCDGPFNPDNFWP